MTRDLPWAHSTASGVSLTIDVILYPVEVVLRVCHAFTARCYVFAHAAGDGKVVVDFAPRDDGDALNELAGEFSNALIDGCLRALIAAETKQVRELIVAQAFCEADLLDHRDVESDESADPRRILR